MNHNDGFWDNWYSARDLGVPPALALRLARLSERVDYRRGLNHWRKAWAIVEHACGLPALYSVPWKGDR